MELKNLPSLTSSNYLVALFSNFVFKVLNHHNLILFFWNNNIFILCYFLYYHINCQYKCFVDLMSSDYLELRHRFVSVYNLLSIRYNKRVFLSTSIADSLMIDSIVGIYINAIWYERESWDMYGILYKNNTDLRRILNDYGFKGFPLRKDFPLSGFLEVKYDYLKKSISYEPVRLIQGFRHFNTKIPWNFYNH